MTPLESSAFVPAEAYNATVPVYGRWVIVPPELPDAIETENETHADLVEQEHGSIVPEYENSAEVTA